MNNQKTKNFYNVVIVGAGIAGLECAEKLGNSGLKILLVERNKNVGEKVCAGGVSLKDMGYLPKDVLNFPFKKILLHYKNKTVAYPENGEAISTINREKLLKDKFERLKQLSNLDILTAASALKMTSKNSLKLSDGREINFNFLVGADGSLSIVRKYLNLPLNKMEVIFQYLVPKKFKNFILYLDSKLFGSGYVWIFPHQKFTSIGCGSDLRFINPQKLKNNFDLWLKKNKIDVSNAKLESSLLNYDYQGYKFDNIFLTGDAAGLASGFTGKGIYSAFLSGEQAANDILRKSNPNNSFDKWLRKKKMQEKLIFFLKNPVLKKIFFSLAIRIVSYNKIQKKITSLIN